MRCEGSAERVMLTSLEFDGDSLIGALHEEPVLSVSRRIRFARGLAAFLQHAACATKVLDREAYLTSFMVAAARRRL